MKPSEILREAAMRIDEGRSTLGCTAINAADDHQWSYAASDAHCYFNLTAPSAQRPLMWFGGTEDPKNQDRRVIALCLAAAIAESENQ